MVWDVERDDNASLGRQGVESLTMSFYEQTRVTLACFKWYLYTKAQKQLKNVRFSSVHAYDAPICVPMPAYACSTHVGRERGPQGISG